MGAIRSYWAGRGWETNPALGYPISNELAPKAGSTNRFSDFENGVVYWKAANGYTSELTAFPPASRAREDMQNEAQQKIAQLLQPYGDKAYIDRAVQITEVSDYSRSGAMVYNRQIKLSLRLKYKAEFIGIDGLLPDPYTDMDLWISIQKQAASSGTAVTLTLNRALLRTTVPAPTNAVISPETINAKLKDSILTNVIGKPQVLGIIPASLNVLSVKVMPDGGVSTFVEPLS